MTTQLKAALLLGAISLLGACSKSPPIVALGGAATDNPAAVARIREGSMQLRGFDGKRFGISETTNPLYNFVYGAKPGAHVLWAMNIQGGHPLMLEGLRCYVIEANLSPDVTYRLDEDKEAVRAVLKREDNGVQVAIGRLVDRQVAYSEGCKWERTHQE